jgi:hypothetical protein
MRDKWIIDSIVDYKSAVFLCIYRGGGWTHYKQTPRANFVNLVNKPSKKLGTLIGFLRARTVGPQAQIVRLQGRTVWRLILVLNICPPAFWWS